MGGALWVVNSRESLPVRKQKKAQALTPRLFQFQIKLPLDLEWMRPNYLTTQVEIKFYLQ